MFPSCGLFWPEAEPDMEQWTGSKLGEYFVKTGKGVFCYPVYLTYTEYIIQNAGLDESQAGIKMPGEISISSDMQMILLLWQKVKN